MESKEVGSLLRCVNAVTEYVVALMDEFYAIDKEQKYYLLLLRCKIISLQQSKNKSNTCPY